MDTMLHFDKICPEMGRFAAFMDSQFEGNANGDYNRGVNLLLSRVFCLFDLEAKQKALWA